jgi:hypothetical protein
MILGSGVYVFVHYEEISSPCLPPLAYSVASPDPRFGITKEQVIAYAQEAEAVWESKIGKDLFAYDPTGEFTIRFSYDARQENTFHAQELEISLEEQTSEYEELKKEFDEQNESVEKKIQVYNTRVANFEQKLKNFNEEMGEWNKKGGVTKEASIRLQEEQAELMKEQDEINAFAESINEHITQTQNQAKTLNQSVTTLNQNVDLYNSLFENMPTFSKGVYNGGEIILYQFKSKEDLILTLAHEFGHALGIGHIDDPSSLMYPYIKDQSLDPIEITFFDIQEANTVCRFTD